MDIKTSITNQDFDHLELQKDAEEDEEYGCFFLKPASSPYNIAEKVQQANLDLLNITIAEQRQSRVTFREQLVTFEPELTDDDVVSIESDRSDTTSNDNIAQILEYKTTVYADAQIYSIEEEECANDDDDDDEDIEEDSLDSDGSHRDDDRRRFRFGHYQTDGDDRDPDGSLDNVPTIPADTCNDAPSRLNFNDNIKVLIDGRDGETTRVTDKRKPAKKKKRSLPEIKACIDCRSHCIEKLDSKLSMSIKRLELREKPPIFPPLKLYERKCCSGGGGGGGDHHQVTKNLPCYNGLRSEYGLNLAQLERRRKTRELTRLKQLRRQELLEEYRERRSQQNEEVFRQWLKDIARRKSEAEARAADAGRHLGGVGGPKQGKGEGRRQRPRTTEGSSVETTAGRARPHTSDAYLCIQVPDDALARRIDMNHLLSKASDLSCKRLHIMAFS